MRLTAELIEKSSSFINAVKDRELDLRNNKIPTIENLAVTRDQYDCIDISCNELRRLDNFPLLKRLRTLLVSCNAVSTLQFGERVPSLEMLVLNNNPISEVGLLADLRPVKTLRYLSLIDCPVTRTPEYRLQVIKTLPQLRALDFQRITASERRQAAVLNGEASSTVEQEPPRKMVKLERERVEEAVRNAKTLDEIKQLERILATGHVPN